MREAKTTPKNACTIPDAQTTPLNNEKRTAFNSSLYLRRPCPPSHQRNPALSFPPPLDTRAGLPRNISSDFLILSKIHYLVNQGVGEALAVRSNERLPW